MVQCCRGCNGLRDGCMGLVGVKIWMNLGFSLG